VKAIRQYEFGEADTLRYEDQPDPEPGEGQVRIRVAAAGVHLVDTTIRRGGQLGPNPPPTLPMTPGREVAGTVDALGPGVDPGWLGRRVVAHLGAVNGGYAELAVAAVGSLHELPTDLAYEAAVALIGTGRTAVAILELAALSTADVVLVTAAAGGIGALLVQAARRAGAVTVGAAGGPAKVDQVRALGADVAVDYSEPGWDGAVRAALGDRAVTVSMDGVGGTLGRTALELVGLGGRILFYGWASGEPTPFTVWDLYSGGLTVSCAIGARILQGPGGLRGLEETSLALAASGAWTPLVGRPYPLADAAGAHRALESRATIGKTVLVP
jgi:NADPH2:quinone reductase